MKLTDEMLYQYAGEARDLWLSTLPQQGDVPVHSFSKRFHRKMNRLLRQQRRSPQMQHVMRYARNAAVFALVLAGVSFAGLMSVDAYRGAVIDVITRKLDDTLARFTYSSPMPEESAEFVDIAFTYLPDGMEENEGGFFESTTERRRQLERDDGTLIELEEHLITADNDFSAGIVTEDKISEEQFQIGADQATMITRKDDTSATGIGVSVMWTHGDVAYMLWTNLPSDEAKKIVLGIDYLPYDAQAAKEKREKQQAEADAYAEKLEQEAVQRERQKPALMEELGLHFTEEEVDAAIAVAQQYYEAWSKQECDPNAFTAEEYDAIVQFRDWLRQGVEITYDKDAAFSYIMGSSVKQQIEQNGAGTAIILTVTIPAATEEQGKRIIELDRENAQSEWVVRTEGLR